MLARLCVPFVLLAALTAEAPPAPIRLNQLGLLADGPQRAMLPSQSSQPLPWSLTAKDGRVLATGRTEVFGPDRFSGENVHRIEFSGKASAGDGYRLTAGDLSSRPFAVSSAGNGRLPYDALAFFYHQRSGIPIEARLVGEKWARPAGHPRDLATCVSGLDARGNAWPGCSYTLDASGGWYDAGDHGKYVVNGGIALWTLQNLYELGRLRGSPLFVDGSAHIPESGNGISDLLDEARWEMEFMLRMQAPEGSRQRVPIGVTRNAPGLTLTEISTSGMAHHKTADERWTMLPMRPDRDPQRRVLFPPSTAATLNLAATAAQCGRIWRDIDKPFADRCVTAAKRAWTAARLNPRVYAIADFNGSGGYGDADVSDEFYWAAAELLTTTGDAEYRRAVEASPHFRQAISAPGWASVAALGSITLALHPAAIDGAEATRLRTDIERAAGSFLLDRRSTGYEVPMASRWTWGSNSILLNRAMLLALAYNWTGAPQYRDGVIDAMDFILGRNPLDRSFVSGYGARPMDNPHHRFWAHSLDSTLPGPPPGVLSGGPNNEAMSDEVAARMKGTCAPQTCWVDDVRAYSMNEVAINWNAPLVWVSAWLADGRSARANTERGE
jgi:endoglucanase